MPPLSGSFDGLEKDNLFITKIPILLIFIPTWSDA